MGLYGYAYVTKSNGIEIDTIAHIGERYDFQMAVQEGVVADDGFTVSFST